MRVAFNAQDFVAMRAGVEKMQEGCKELGHNPNFLLTIRANWPDNLFPTLFRLDFDVII